MSGESEVLGILKDYLYYSKIPERVSQNEVFKEIVSTDEEGRDLSGPVN